MAQKHNQCCVGTSVMDQRVKEIRGANDTWYSMNFLACSLSSSLDSLKEPEEQICKTTSLRENVKL
jgi:hypothetical protein